MSKNEEPTPPPSFRGQEYVTMLETEQDQPLREPTPAHQVQAFRRRNELNPDDDDPSDDDDASGVRAAMHIPTHLRKISKTARRWLRWMVTDPKLIRDRWYASATANDLLREGFTMEDIAQQLDIDTLDNWFHQSLALRAPLNRIQWETLIDEFGLRYPDLFARFELQTVPQYVSAGIGPAVLKKLGVSFETLLTDRRIDARSLHLFSFDDWKDLGIAAVHVGRLGPDALDSFTIRQWRSIGVTVPVLEAIHVTPDTLAQRKNLAVEAVLSALVSEGTYGLHDIQVEGLMDARLPHKHKHEVWLDTNGDGYCTEVAGHSHEVIDGVVQVAAGHTHTLVRYVE